MQLFFLYFMIFVNNSVMIYVFMIFFALYIYFVYVIEIVTLSPLTKVGITKPMISL